MHLKRLCLAGVFFYGMTLMASQSHGSDTKQFDIIAHRGASGYLPEHTLAAAALAHAQHADFIEQDVVLSKDGIPVVLHDIHLETVTDVESRYPSRHRKDGRWYAIDFTLAELKALVVHERQDSQQKPVFANRYQGTGEFHIATLDEHISTIQSLNRATGKQVGFYPEIKSPAFHRGEGYDISKAVVEILIKHGLNHKRANIYIQCFDFAEIKRLREELGLKTRLVQLFAENEWQESPTDYDWLKSNDGLQTLENYVDGVGPWAAQLVTRDEDGKLQTTDFAKRLQASSFAVHPYTFRLEQVPKELDVNDWLDLLVQAGADGVFTDQVPPVHDWKAARFAARKAAGFAAKTDSTEQ